MTRAKAPTRGDKVTLEFGLVTIGVQLFNAVDENEGRIVRHMRYGDGHPVGNDSVDKSTGESVAKSDVYMAYTTEEGIEVELTDDEIAASMGFDQKHPAETLGIYPEAEADKYLKAGSIQVRPAAVTTGSKKKSHPYDKVFALFMNALAINNAFVLIKYVARGKPKLVAIYSDGTGEFLHWQNEIRENAPLIELDDVENSEAERKMANTLVKTLMQDEAPLLENDAYMKVRDYAETKAAGVEIPKQGQPTIPANGMDDVLAKLQASIEAVKEAK